MHISILSVWFLFCYFSASIAQVEATSLSRCILHICCEGYIGSISILYTHAGTSIIDVYAHWTANKCFLVHLVLCLMQQHVLKRPFAPTRSVVFATLFMCCFSAVIALFKVNIHYDLWYPGTKICMVIQYQNSVMNSAPFIYERLGYPWCWWR